MYDVSTVFKAFMGLAMLGCFGMSTYHLALSWINPEKRFRRKFKSMLRKGLGGDLDLSPMNPAGFESLKFEAARHSTRIDFKGGTVHVHRKHEWLMPSTEALWKSHQDFFSKIRRLQKFTKNQLLERIKLLKEANNPEAEQEIRKLLQMQIRALETEEANHISQFNYLLKLDRENFIVEILKDGERIPNPQFPLRMLISYKGKPYLLINKEGDAGLGIFITSMSQFKTAELVAFTAHENSQKS